MPEGRLRRVVDRLRSARRPGVRSVRRRQEQRPRRVTACSTTGPTRSRPTARPTRRRSARSSRSPATASTAWPTRMPDGPIRFRRIRSTCRRTCSSSCRNAAFSYDPNLKNGRLQSWNVTVEREIMPTYLRARGLCRLAWRSSGDRPRAERRPSTRRAPRRRRPISAGRCSRLRHASRRIESSGRVRLPRAAAHARQAHEQAGSRC